MNAADSNWRQSSAIGGVESVHFETVTYVIIGRVDAHTSADALSFSP